MIPDALAEVFARMGVTASPIDPAQYQDTVQTKREAVWHRACQLGQCRFALEDVTHQNPPAVDSTITCGGYHGERHVGADNVVTWRWRICDRHRRWQERRAEYVRNHGKRRPRRDLED